MIDILRENITCDRNESLAPNPFAVFGAIALPHFLYAYIWFNPEKWMKMFPKSPVDAFATAGAIGKGKRQAGWCNSLITPSSSNSMVDLAVLAFAMLQ